MFRGWLIDNQTTINKWKQLRPDFFDSSRFLISKDITAISSVEMVIGADKALVAVKISAISVVLHQMWKK